MGVQCGKIDHAVFMYNFVLEYRKITSISKCSLLEKKVFEDATKVNHVSKGGL